MNVKQRFSKKSIGWIVKEKKEKLTRLQDCDLMRRLPSSTELNTWPSTNKKNALPPLSHHDLLEAKPHKCWWQVDVKLNLWPTREIFHPAALSESVIKTFPTSRPLIDPRWAGRVDIYCGV